MEFLQNLRDCLGTPFHGPVFLAPLFLHPFTASLWFWIWFSVFQARHVQRIARLARIARSPLSALRRQRQRLGGADHGLGEAGGLPGAVASDLSDRRFGRAEGGEWRGRARDWDDDLG